MEFKERMKMSFYAGFTQHYLLQGIQNNKVFFHAIFDFISRIVFSYCAPFFLSKYVTFFNCAYKL